MNITEKENTLLKAIAAGMDEPGCGWLHEIAGEDCATRGTLGALVKKGLVTSQTDEEGGCWVALNDAGWASVQRRAATMEIHHPATGFRLYHVLVRPGGTPRATVVEAGAGGVWRLDTNTGIARHQGPNPDIFNGVGTRFRNLTYTK